MENFPPRISVLVPCRCFASSISLIPTGNERVPLAELASLFGIFSSSSPSLDPAVFYYCFAVLAIEEYLICPNFNELLLEIGVFIIVFQN